jgi:hypothetical protein
MSKVKTVIIASLLAASITGSAVQAHHSVAAYDYSKVMAVTGTVKEFKYTNPHSWIYVIVPDGNGGEQEWDLEGGSVNMLLRKGWTKDTIKPGMKVKLRVAPRKDGSIGGEWQAVIEVDGKPFELNKE